MPLIFRAAGLGGGYESNVRVMELRRDLRNGASKGEILKDRQEIKSDLKEIHGDRVDLRNDQNKLDSARRELRGDLRKR